MDAKEGRAEAMLKALKKLEEEIKYGVVAFELKVFC